MDQSLAELTGRRRSGPLKNTRISQAFGVVGSYFVLVQAHRSAGEIEWNSRILKRVRVWRRRRRRQRNARVIVKGGKRPVAGFASLIWLDRLDSCQEDRDLEYLSFPFPNSTIRTLFSFIATIRTLRLTPKGYVALLPNVLCRQVWMSNTFPKELLKWTIQYRQQSQVSTSPAVKRDAHSRAPRLLPGG